MGKKKESVLTPERVLCAAIHYRDGKVRVFRPKNIESGLVVVGRMHNDCIQILYEMFPSREYLNNYIDGFITSHNRFLDRKEAAILAWQEKQITEQVEELFSEQLYYDQIWGG